jgi:hypothetical protein
MPQNIPAFFVHSLAVSVAGPLVGVVLFFVVMPSMLWTLIFLPLVLLGAYQIGLIPAFLTSIVLFFARTHLKRPLAALVTAIAAATFGAAWVYWLVPVGQNHSLHITLIAVSAAASLFFSVPKWDGRQPLGQ